MEAKDREIARILSGKGISWSDLTEKQKKEVKRVFDIVSPKIEKIKALREEIEKYRFNRSTLAEELNVTRKTIGTNNPPLDALVDVFIQKQKELIYRTPSGTKPGDEISALQERINQYMARDCELVEMDEKFRELQEELTLREKQCAAFLKEKQSLKKEKEELEREYKKAVSQLQLDLNPFKTKNNNLS